MEALEKDYTITGLPTFVENEHGKPSLQEYPDIHFNLSHCHNIVACAVDNAPVGIDAEDLGRYSECVARYCMNDDEMSQIGTSDIIFTRLWTQKEAVFKLQGTGIRDNIKDILLPQNLTNIKIMTEEHLEEGYILSIARYTQ
jgi:4'-phosphopantetheinyl transferase